MITDVVHRSATPTSGYPTRPDAAGMTTTPSPTPPVTTGPSTSTDPDRPRRDGSAADGDVVVAVLAAARGWPLYRRCSGFLLRPGRSLRQVGQVAFYCGGRVQPLVATVLGRREDVVVDAASLAAAEQQDPPLAAVLRTVLDDGGWPEERADVLLLSGPDDPATLDVGAVEHGRAQAWARTQRYVRLGDLRAATRTDDLPTV